MTRLSPFVVARPGLEVAELPGLVRVDPLRLSSAAFLARVEALDARVYGGTGLASPRWVLFDCAELPGAVLGLATGGELLPAGIVAATPLVETGGWLLYALSTVDEAVAPRGTLLDLAFALLRPRRVLATTQWGGPELAAFAARGRLVLGAAWLPLHTVAATCAFEIAAPSTRAPARREELDPRDPAALRVVQRAIEDGVEVAIVGPPGPGGRIPLALDGP